MSSIILLSVSGLFLFEGAYRRVRPDDFAGQFEKVACLICATALWTAAGYLWGSQ